MAEEEKKEALEPGDNKTTKSSKDFKLLLKNYEDLMVRSSHWTPLPNGSAPLDRPLKEYMRFFFLSLVFYLTSCILLSRSPNIAATESSTLTNLQILAPMKLLLGLSVFFKLRKLAIVVRLIPRLLVV